MFLAQAYVYALAGDPNQAREITEKVLRDSNAEQIDFTDAAVVYAALRENDLTFEYLEKAFVKADTNILLLRTDPRFASIRDDKRYNVLLKKLKL